MLAPPSSSPPPLSTQECCGKTFCCVRGDGGESVVNSSALDAIIWLERVCACVRNMWPVASVQRASIRMKKAGVKNRIALAIRENYVEIIRIIVGRHDLHLIQYDRV